MMGIETLIIAILLLALGSALVAANIKIYLALVRRPWWRLPRYQLTTLVSRRLLLWLAFSAVLTFRYFSSDGHPRLSLLAVALAYVETIAFLLVLGMLGSLPAYATYGLVHWRTQYRRRDVGGDQNE